MKEKLISKLHSRVFWIEDMLYPLILLLLPLTGVNQGVDVSDSTYSLGNYLFTDRVSLTWITSTYLSNLLGSLMVRLPFGHYLLGANIYSGLLLGAIGLFVYFALRRQFGAGKVMLAEFIAISFCWIPTTILYNYLSYLFMAIGALLVYKGMDREDKKMLFAAGIVLGMNVFVRIPNLTNAALIIVVWAGCYLYKKKDWIARTLVCLGGYVTGLLIPIIMICIQYGISSLGTMIKGLVGITSTDETYTPLSMITDTLAAYGRSAKWAGTVLVVTVACMLLFMILKDRFLWIKRLVTLGLICLMLRFFWGRGMFSFRYYEDYSSMYEWGMLALYMSLGAVIYVLVSKAFSAKIKLYGVLALVVIAISPLGSNNYTYQNLNNLFLVLPLTVYVIGHIVQSFDKKVFFPLKTMALVLTAMIALQSFGFHVNFSFRDGMDGTKRDTYVWGVDSLKGMYTNYINMASLTTLYDYIDDLDNESIIYFGDCPGLSYIFRIPSAMGSSWCDLDSYSMEDFTQDLEECKNDSPPVIIRNCDASAVHYGDKLNALNDYMEELDYWLVFENTEYKLYCR